MLRKNFLKSNENNGITLIALIITIIVMLILVAITVKVTLDGGLFKKAGKVVSETERAKTVEKIELAITDARLNNFDEDDGDFTMEDLQQELDKQFGEGKAHISIYPDDTVRVTVENNVYKINRDLTVESTDIAVVEPADIEDWEFTVQGDNTVVIESYVGTDTEVVIPSYIGGLPVIGVVAQGTGGNLWVGKLDNSEDSVILPVQNNNSGNAVIERASLNGSSAQFVLTASSSGSSSGSTSGSSSGSSSGSASGGEPIIDHLEETITKVTISEGILFIGEGAFSNSIALEEVYLPSTLQYIGSGAFANCSSLENVSIPSSVQMIGEDAFSGIAPGTTITCNFASKPAEWDLDWTDCENVIWKE